MQGQFLFFISSLSVIGKENHKQWVSWVTPCGKEQTNAILFKKESMNLNNFCCKLKKNVESSFFVLFLRIV